ncbi:hypothetical protein [Marisediminitalea sp.]|uniref:hypothetical protein n=1 Tax=Marisediminitalea sp. TaxID=2662268 RepID=UPI0035170237
MKQLHKSFIVLAFALPIAVQAFECLPHTAVRHSLGVQAIVLCLTGAALLYVFGLFVHRALKR